MGASSPKLYRQIELLKEFRRYESEIYQYFYEGKSKEDLFFYLVPKKYINQFCENFHYSKNISDLDNYILYNKNLEQEAENKAILNIIIGDLNQENNDIINNNINLHRIINEDIIEKRDNNIFFKINEESSYIPLNQKIWNELSNYCGSDLTLEKKGFANNGEIFLEIEYKRVDCFFTLLKTNDLIYHYCFVLDDIKEYDNFIKYLKGDKSTNSVRYLLSVLNINFCAENKFEKFRKKIVDVDKLIDNYDMTIYFIDSFKFKDSSVENIKLIKNNKNNLYLSYIKKEEEINKQIKDYKNRHSLISNQ